MEYENLKIEIDKKVIELAKLIEKFCVIENKTYTQSYKNRLNDLHIELEEINN